MNRHYNTSGYVIFSHYGALLSLLLFLHFGSAFFAQPEKAKVLEEGDRWIRKEGMRKEMKSLNIMFSSQIKVSSCVTSSYTFLLPELQRRFCHHYHHILHRIALLKATTITSHLTRWLKTPKTWQKLRVFSWWEKLKVKDSLFRNTEMQMRSE